MNKFFILVFVLYCFVGVLFGGEKGEDLRPDVDRGELFVISGFDDAEVVGGVKIAGDFEFVLWSRRHGAKFELLDLDVAIVELGGVSDRNYYPRCADWYRAARRYHFWNWRMHLHYYKKLHWARWMDSNKD